MSYFCSEWAEWNRTGQLSLHGTLNSRTSTFFPHRQSLVRAWHFTEVFVLLMTFLFSSSNNCTNYRRPSWEGLNPQQSRLLSRVMGSNTRQHPLLLPSCCQALQKGLWSRDTPQEPRPLSAPSRGSEPARWAAPLHQEHSWASPHLQQSPAQALQTPTIPMFWLFSDPF